MRAQGFLFLKRLYMKFISSDQQSLDLNSTPVQYNNEASLDLDADDG